MIWVKGKYGKETAIRGESRRLSARTASGARQYTGIVCAPSLSGQKCARFSRLRPLRAPSCRFLAVSCGCRAEPANFTAKRSAPIGVNNSHLSKPQACVTLPTGANFPKINKPKFSAFSAPRRRLSRKNSPSSPRPICFSEQKKSNETNRPKENIGKEKSFACQKSRNVVK